MKLFSPYIAKILVVLLLIMVSAFPCYSRTYKEIYNLYEEKFRSPKDFEDKNYPDVLRIGLYTGELGFWLKNVANN